MKTKSPQVKWIGYSNGNFYLGELINEDTFHGKGLFFYKDYGFYLGNWINGIKQGQGICVWFDQDNFNNDNINYKDTFIGNYLNGRYAKGFYISNCNCQIRCKDLSKNYIYFGSFDMDKTKTDKNCFLYDLKKEFIFNGVIAKNKAKEGYQMTYKDNKLSNLIGFKTNVINNDVEELIKESYLDNKLIIKIKEKIKTFIEFIVEINLSKEIKEIINYVEFTIKSIDDEYNDKNEIKHNMFSNIVANMEILEKVDNFMCNLND